MSLILDGTNGLSDVDGSAGTPAIRGSDTNTGIFFDADIIGFSEGGTECARFNADAQFVAAAGTASLPVITTTGDVNTGIFFPAADTIAFAEGGAEAMRIDSSGNLLVGTTTANFNFSSGWNILINSGASYTNTAHANGTSSGAGYANFVYNSGIIGSISQNGTTGVLYNLTSDYRLKNNPQALTGAKDFVMALQPKKWQWWDGSGEGVGFIAHEFMEVAKHSGSGEKDAVDADGKPIMQSIQPSSSEVMANLVAFIQEQQQIITALTARVEALEGAQG
jgi:hypothetical protein